MKKIFLTFFTALTVFFVTDSTTIAANNGENYDDYPGIKIVVEELNADGSREAIENLKKIAALSEKELIDLNDILSNPDRLAEELSKPENLMVESVDMDYSEKVESYDMNYSRKLGLQKYSIRSSAFGYPGRVTVVTSLRALGIDLIKYELTGEFTVNITKTRFISADHMDGVVIRKWLPQVITKKIGTPTKSVTDTQFTGQVTFSYDLGVGSWGIARIGVVRTGFKANTKQVTNSWAYPE
ncbi:hypothetical protein [Lysinibacillus sphaericus]|uniref:hypothetical protein n=1 Tax=Lysinibacillus sphaericus TaxID=1421 RepID=UPI003D704A4F